MWQASVDAQTALYDFFADLLPAAALAQQFADFAVRQLSRYQILLQALQATGSQRGWSLHLDLNPRAEASPPSVTPASPQPASPIA